MFRLLGEEKGSKGEKLYRLENMETNIELIFTASQAHELAKIGRLANYRDVVTASGEKDISKTNYVRSNKINKADK